MRRRSTTRAGSGSSASCDIAVTMEADQSVGPAIVTRVNEQLRRRSVGAPAARSVAADHARRVRPAGAGGVWQETLIGALGTLGHKTHAARQALARSVGAGWLRTERHGRRSRVHLTPETADMLRSGAERIYTFGAPWEWDGRWLLVVLRVPEERREVRHQMRTRLAWAGFGVARRRPVDHPARRARARARRRRGRRLGGRARELPRRARRARGARAASSPRRGTSTRWPTPTARSSRASAGCARAARRPCSAPRRCSSTSGGASRSSTPTCPRACSRARWPRGRAHELFHARHAEWDDTARAWFAALEHGGEASGGPDRRLRSRRR